MREQLGLIYKPKPVAPEFVHNFVSYYTQVIEDRGTGKRKITRGKKKGNRFTSNAIKNYKTSLAVVKRYLEYKGIRELSFEDVNTDFYDDFMNFIYDVDKKEVSTFAGYIKDIKSIMNEVAPATFKSKDFVKPSYEADTIYLNDAQIDMIVNLDLSDYSKNYMHKVKGKADLIINYQTLDKTRDLALLGFYSGLRFSDFSTLEPKNIEGNFIRLKQTKTKDRVTIPIMESLKPVLTKYPEGLPLLTNQRFNFYIKIVSKLAGLTQMQEITTNIGGNEVKAKHPLYSLVSSHTCRRSYATNMFKKRVPPILIMSATGHKTESSFLLYIRATNEQKAEPLAETLKDLGL